MQRRYHSPQPNDSPMARCSECNQSYNPYKHGLNCPHCDDE